MAATTNVQVVISGRDNASHVIRGVGKSFSTLGQEATAGLKKIGILGLIGGAALTAFGVKAGFSAARVEELGFALNAIAKANKISQKEVDKTVDALRSFNIAHDKALEITSLFIQSELDLADAVKLATVAKDLAVLASLDSSDATKQLTRAIVTQRPILLKQFGIQTGLVKIYDTYAETVGKTAEELTEAEKKQAFLNIILEKGKKVAGTYEAAMGSVSKRFRSLTGRIIPDFMAKIGKAFQPALTAIVDAIADSIANLSDLVDANQDKIKEWGKIGGIVARQLVSSFGKVIKFLAANKEILIGVLAAFAAGIVTVGIAFVIAHKLIIGIFLGITLQVAMFVKMWNDSWKAITVITQTASKFLSNKIVPNFNKVFSKIKNIVEGVIDSITDKWENFISEVSKLSTAFSNLVEDFKKDFEGTFDKVAENIAILMLERIDTIFTGWTKGFDEMVNAAADWGVDTYEIVDQWITDTLVAIVTWVHDTLDAFFDWGDKAVDSVNDGLDNMLVALSDFFTELPDKITTWLDEVWQNIKTWWSDLGKISLNEILKGFDKERDNWILKIVGFILAALAIVLALLAAELIDLGIKIIKLILKGSLSLQIWARDKLFALIKGALSIGGKVGTAIFDFGKSIVTKLIDGIKAAPKAVGNAILSLIPNAALRSAVKKAIPGLQHGTNFFAGGPAIVGERGPELVNLPRGSQVTPTERLPMGSTFHITLQIGTLIDSDHARRNFAERLLNDIENIAAMKGKKLSTIE